MNNYSCDRIDAIMTLAMAEYAKELTDEFLSAKPDFELSEQAEQRILRLIRKDKHRTTRKNAGRIVKYIMVACLIAATLAFTACMAFPRIRQAIWKAIVEWHDDYIAVKFVPDETEDSNASAIKPSDTLSTNASDTPNDPISVPPDSIVEVNIPTYMPMGYTTNSTLMERAFTVNYFDKNNAFMFCFSQMIFSSDSKGDAEEGTATDTTINGLSAVVITYSDEPNVYTLYWQDNQYRYSIYGYFEDYNELIQLATSVEVK